MSPEAEIGLSFFGMLLVAIVLAFLTTAAFNWGKKASSADFLGQWAFATLAWSFVIFWAFNGIMG